jgi:peptidoglycan/LPS O-acetylase OafA/YrhL
VADPVGAAVVALRESRAARSPAPSVAEAAEEARRGFSGSRLGFRADIQGLRGIAVLLVVLYHAGNLVPRGFLGVDMFFAISGFVITGSLVGEFVATGRLNLGSFYARRVRRLLPALALMICFVAVAGVLAAPFEAQPLASATAAAAALFGANVYLMHLSTGYFQVQTTIDPLLHTWTLGVEEQFYVISPLLLLLVLRSRRVLTAFAGVFAVGIVSFDLFMVGSNANGPGHLAFYASPARAWEFGLGALTAMAVLVPLRPKPRLALGAGIAGLLLVDAAVFGGLQFPVFMNGRVGMAALGTCLLMFAGSGAATPLARLLSIRPLVELGALSYSWYLWHWPFIVYAKALFPQTSWVPEAAALASLVPAWLSYRLLETPVRQSRRRALVLAPVCVGLSLAAAAVLAVSHDMFAGNPRFAQLLATQRLHADVTRGCDVADRLDAGTPCLWGPAGAPVVALVGDSNAGHFTEPVASAAARLGYRSFVSTHSSCPYAELVMRIDGDDSYGRLCQAYVDESVGQLLALKPRLVVISSRSDKYIAQLDMAFIDAGGAAPVATTPAAKQRAYELGVERVASRLTAAGIPVLLVQPVPLMDVAPDNCAIVLVITNHCVSRATRATVTAELSRAVAANRLAAARTANVATVSFLDALCDTMYCSTRSHGRENYRDAEHLSVAGALALTPDFQRLITRYAAGA